MWQTADREHSARSSALARSASTWSLLRSWRSSRMRWPTSAHVGGVSFEHLDDVGTRAFSPFPRKATISRISPRVKPTAWALRTKRSRSRTSGSYVRYPLGVRSAASMTPMCS